MAATLFNYVIPVVHILVCLFLIVVVLLQTGKGADMGAVFGGGSQTLFGSSGAGNFLTRMTTGMALIFMITSLGLSVWASRSTSSQLLQRLPAPASAPEGGTEGAPAAAEGGEGTAPEAPSDAPGIPPVGEPQPATP